MVSPYFFSRRLWKVMTFFSCPRLTAPIFLRRLSSVLYKFSNKKINFSRVSPLEGVTRGGSSPLRPPSDATEYLPVSCMCCDDLF